MDAQLYIYISLHFISSVTLSPVNVCAMISSTVENQAKEIKSLAYFTISLILENKKNVTYIYVDIFV